MGKKKHLTPEERDALFERMDLDNQLAKLETQFRDILLKERVYTEISLPTRRTHEKEDAVARSLDKTKKKQDKAQTQDENASLLTQTISANCFKNDIDDTFALNEQDVFSRLRIRGLNEQVMAYIDIDNDTIVPNSKQEPAESEGQEEPEEPEEQYFPVAAWHKAIVRGLDLPTALVAVTFEEKAANREGVLEVKKKLRPSASR